MTKLYWIDIGYACFGIEVSNQVVIDAPPIAKWMKVKALQDIKLWLTGRGG